MTDIKIDLNTIKVDEETHTLSSDNSPFSLSLRVDNFDSDKDFHKTITACEKLIRVSPEYKYWISYIVDTLGYRYCSLTKETIEETTIVIHHHPIPLYSICKAVIDARIQKQQKFCTFDIATDVIELHFKNKVGYIPLLSNIHEKYHSGFQLLPIEHVHGDYQYLLDNFPFDSEDKERISKLCQIHLKDCKIDWTKNHYPGLDGV